MPHRHAHCTIWWRQFFSWSFLFPSVSSWPSRLAITRYDCVITFHLFLSVFPTSSLPTYLSINVHHYLSVFHLSVIFCYVAIIFLSEFPCGGHKILWPKQLKDEIWLFASGKVHRGVMSRQQGLEAAGHTMSSFRGREQRVVILSWFSILYSQDR